MTVSEILSSTAPKVNMVSRPSFTCASCHSIFENAEAQRAHYQSDWHRYNLRRKVADLPPVTETTFASRLDLLDKETATIKAAQVSRTFECTACKKTFNSEKSFENHIKSRKHLDAASTDRVLPIVRQKTANDDSKKPTDMYLDNDATEEQIKAALDSKLTLARRLAAEECIFCNRSFETFESNMEHMAKDHSLYIPDLDFIDDLTGLVRYLADKVSVAFCCLYCPSSRQPFHSLESVRRHMVDKGHLKIRFDDEGMDELADFYNYEEVVSDDGDDSFVDVDINGEEDSEDYGSGKDEYLYVSPDGTELVLSSGKRIGHRAYRIYYKQYLRTDELPARPSRRSEHQELVSRMSDHYFAVGLAPLVEHRRHIAAQRRLYDNRKKWDARIGIRTNKLQEHFRIQLRQ